MFIYNKISISVQTETVDDAIQKLFNTHASLYSTTEHKIKLNGSVVIVHSLVVAPKCKFLENSISIHGVTDLSDKSPELVTNFLKLLYGYKLSLTHEQLYELWDLAFELKYSKIASLEELVFKNLKYYLTSYKIKLLFHPQLVQADVIKQCSFNDIKTISTAVQNVELLQLMVKESITRYSNDTKALQVCNTTLRKELKDAKKTSGVPD